MNAGWRASGRFALGEEELQVAALVEEQQLQQQAAGHVGEDVEQQLKEQVFRSFCPEAEQQQVVVLGEEQQRLGSGVVGVLSAMRFSCSGAVESRWRDATPAWPWRQPVVEKGIRDRKCQACLTIGAGCPFSS